MKFHTVVLTSIIAVANEKHGGNESLFPPLIVFAPPGPGEIGSSRGWGGLWVIIKSPPGTSVVSQESS